jgi:hypothetical protein
MVLLSNMENKFLYNSIEPTIIENFLEKDNKENLIKWIDLKWKKLYYDKKNIGLDFKKEVGNDHFQVIKLDPLAGKTFLNLGPNDFPKEFWQKAEESAKKINPNCEFEYVSIVKYSSEFGEPTLRPHFDTPSKAVFIVDYQLDGNTEWPISVNLKEYVLKNNQCLIFDNNLSIHWRTPKKFKEEEFLIMLFYSFIDNDKEIPSLDGQSEEISKYLKHYTDEHNKVFGDSDHNTNHTEKLADLFRWAKERDQSKNNEL